MEARPLRISLTDLIPAVNSGGDVDWSDDHVLVVGEAAALVAAVQAAAAATAASALPAPAVADVEGVARVRRLAPLVAVRVAHLGRSKREVVAGAKVKSAIED